MTDCIDLLASNRFFVNLYTDAEQTAVGLYAVGAVMSRQSPAS